MDSDETSEFCTTCGAVIVADAGDGPVCAGGHTLLPEGEEIADWGRQPDPIAAFEEYLAAWGDTNVPKSKGKVT